MPFPHSLLSLADSANLTGKGMLYDIPPTANKRNPRFRSQWTDALGRCIMASQLILDEQPGMLNMMTESTNPEQVGQHPFFFNLAKL